MMKQTLLHITDGGECTKIEQTELIRPKAINKLREHSRQSRARRIAHRIKSKDIFFSFEFLPPRTPFGVKNLLERLYSVQDGGPSFCSVTWHTGSDPWSDKITSATSFASSMARSFNFDTMLHLAANNLTRDQVRAVLQRANLHGIRSILALRGDIQPGWVCPTDGFPHAIDLIRFIKENFGDIFTIGVAGYPSIHHEAKSLKHDLIFLKEKVDAGADFIISQIFFSADSFKIYLQNCKAYGINVPVIPGILPILSYTSLKRITKLCHLEIPSDISNPLIHLENNDKAVTNFGIYFAANLARELLDTGSVPGIHFFTLNREQPTIEVCKQLGLWPMGPQALQPKWTHEKAHLLENYEDILQRHSKYKNKHALLKLLKTVMNFHIPIN